MTFLLAGCTGANPAFTPDVVDAPTADLANAVDLATGGDLSAGPGDTAGADLPSDELPAVMPDAGADAPPDAILADGPVAAVDGPVATVDGLVDGASDGAASDTPDGAAPVTSRYHFESSAQGWTDLRFGYYGAPRTSVVRSAGRAWDGQYALEIALETTASYTSPTIGVAEAFGSRLPAGTRITFRVWFPAGDAIEFLQPFVIYYRPGDRDGVPVWGGPSSPLFASSLVAGQWNTITHRVPADVDSRGVVELGIEWNTRGARNVTVYLDAVTW